YVFPPSPKYNVMWDVNLVLRFLTSWPNNDFLSLKQLSAKLTMLLCLVSIKRVSDVKALDVSSFYFSPLGVSFQVKRRTKTNLACVNYPFFPSQPKLRVGNCLKSYVTRTADLRS
ncbi:hypothetical protein NDU88_006101, partial [Pleurodeles waltl]